MISFPQEQESSQVFDEATEQQLDQDLSALRHNIEQVGSLATQGLMRHLNENEHRNLRI